MQYSLAGIVAMFCLKELFSLLRQVLNLKKTDVSKRMSEEILDVLSGMQEELHELSVLHSAKDSDGVPLWYVRKSLEDAIIKNADNTEKSNELIRVIAENQRRLQDLLELLMKLNSPQT